MFFPLSTRPIEDFCCQIQGCPDRSKRNAGNLYFRGVGGQDKQIRMIYCRTCDTRFSERKGTVLEDCRLPEDKAISVLKHLREGCGTLRTARLVGVSKNTVTRLARVVGEHALKSHDELVAFSPSDP